MPRSTLVCLLLLVLLTGCSGGKAAPTCPAGQTMCSGACVVTGDDPLNCGACGKVCAAGQVCSQGTCSVFCPAGFVDCGGRCVDPQSDRAYCGASSDCQGLNAGTACAAGEVCSAGACVVDCPAGFVECGGRCVDPQNDRGYCGASSDCLGSSAGTACAAGEVCSAGACAVTCQAGSVDCGGTCVDPKTTAAYCGASSDCQGQNAGTACSVGQVCLAGSCQSNDATLKSLTLSTGTISPAFAPGQLLYVVTVGARYDTFTVTPTAAAPGATIAVNGSPVASGTTSAAIPLALGASTPVSIAVKAPGGATETYGLVVMRSGIHYLKASNANAYDSFGATASLSGDTLAVGAPLEASAATGVDGNQSDNTASGSGAVYVFVRSASGVWSQQAYLKASNAEAHDNFGSSVSLSGDTLAVGAPQEASAATGVDGNQSDNTAYGSGAVYVFVRGAAGTWSQQAYIKASNTAYRDGFGGSVSLDHDTLAVAAKGEDSAATGVGGDQTSNAAASSGAVYVFVRNASSVWSQQAYIKASNTDANDFFGSAVSLSGGTLVVGAPQEASSATGVDGNQADNSAGYSGAAYVFVRSAAGAWSQQAYLKASNTNYGDEFGWSVSLDGDTVVVGAEGEGSAATGVGGDQSDNTALTSGAVYVFVRSASSGWSQQAYIKASNTGAGDLFGYSVSLSGNALAVSARLEDSSATGVDGDQGDNSLADSGATYLFVRDASGTWAQQAYLKASNTGANDAFGFSVSLSGGTVAVAAPAEAGPATGVDPSNTGDGSPGSGAVYIY